MRILLIDPVGGHGGMDFYDYGLISGLVSCDVEVFYSTSFETKERNGTGFHTKFFFGSLWMKSGVAKILQLSIGYFNSFRFAKQKNISICHFQFFHLGFQNISALALAKFFGLKAVVTLHDIDSFKKKESYWMQILGYRFSNRIIVHNQLSKKELINKNKSLSQISVIPHGNYKPFVPSFANKISSNGILKLLFFGQIKDVKGLEVLLRALVLLKEKTNLFHLTIAGKPWANELFDYPKMIKELGLETFVSQDLYYIPNEKVDKYFEESDLVVLPYKRIYQSGVLLLAMSYGRAVLCSDLPAFKEIITDNHDGFIFENENSRSLADKLYWIINNPQLLFEITKNADSILNDKYSWDRVGILTKEVYESF